MTEENKDAGNCCVLYPCQTDVVCMCHFSSIQSKYTSPHASAWLVLLSKISMQGSTSCCNQAKFTHGQTTKRNRDFSRNKVFLHFLNMNFVPVPTVLEGAWRQGNSFQCWAVASFLYFCKIWWRWVSIDRTDTACICFSMMFISFWTEKMQVLSYKCLMK